MKTYIEHILEAHPDWPRRIKHGEYIGILSGEQPCSDGNAMPLYRFDGGECVDSGGASIARTPCVEEYGITKCGCCGTDLLCNDCGDMPNLCPVCHEGVDWCAYGGNQHD